MPIVPIDAPTSARPITPVRDYQISPPVNGGWLREIWAAQQLYNPVLNLSEAVRSAFTPINYDYDPIPDIPPEMKHPDLIGSYLKAQNPADTARITASILKEIENRDILKRAGLSGWVAALGAGFTDPFVLALPGFGLLKAGTSTARTYGKTIAFATAANIPSELTLKAGQYTREWEESAIDTIASGILGGIIGGAINVRMAKPHLDEIRDTLNLGYRKPLELPAPRDFPEGIVIPESPNVARQLEEMAWLRAGQEDLKRTITGIQDAIGRTTGEAQRRLKSQLEAKVRDFKEGGRIIGELDTIISQPGIIVPPRKISGLLEGFKKLPHFETKRLPPPEGTIPGETGFTLLTDLEAALARSELPTVETSFPLGSVTSEHVAPRLPEHEGYDLLVNEGFEYYVPAEIMDFSSYRIVTTDGLKSPLDDLTPEQIKLLEFRE